MIKIRNVLSAAIFAAGICSLFAGCQRSDYNEDYSPVQSQTATRLHQLAEANAPDAEPWTAATKGRVIEVRSAAVQLETDEQADGVVFATARDVVVYRGGSEVPLSELRSGEEVIVREERRGNPADGWQSVVVRIDVTGEPGGQPALVGSRSNAPDDTPEVAAKLSGEILEVRSSTVTIRNPRHPELAPSTLPVDPLVRVRKDDLSGGMTLLKKGDRVALTSESRGNRQDGYIHVVTAIEVTDGD